MTRGKRKRRAWGTIIERDKGVWLLQWWGVDHGKRRRMAETVRGTRKEAEARLAELSVKYHAQTEESPTVGQVHDEHWWPLVVETARPNSVSAYSVAWKRHVAPRWADVPVCEVTASAVQEWLASVDSNAAMARSVLSMVMTRAVQLDFIQRNPANGRFRMPKAVKQNDRILNLEELARVWDAVRDSQVEALFLLAAHGGCRVGEALGVMVGEVESKDGYASVRIVRSIGAHGEIGPTKTASSVRTVAVVGQWGERLLALQDQARARGDVWLIDDGLGRPANADTIRNQWSRLIAAAGMEPVQLRKLRTSWETTRHWEMGLPIELTSKGMGHSQISTTWSRYDRPTADAVADAVASAQFASVGNK